MERKQPRRRKRSDPAAVPTVLDMQRLVETIATAEDVTIQEATTMLLIDGIAVWYRYRSTAPGGDDDPAMATALRRAHSIVKHLPHSA